MMNKCTLCIRSYCNVVRNVKSVNFVPENSCSVLSVVHRQLMQCHHQHHQPMVHTLVGGNYVKSDTSDEYSAEECCADNSDKAKR